MTDKPHKPSQVWRVFSLSFFFLPDLIRWAVRRKPKPE